MHVSLSLFPAFSALMQYPGEGKLYWLNMLDTSTHLWSSHPLHPLCNMWLVSDVFVTKTVRGMSRHDPLHLPVPAPCFECIGKPLE